MIKRILQGLRNGVVQGLIVIIPGAVTVWAFIKLFTFSDSFLPATLQKVFPNAPEVWPPGIGILVTITTLWLIGMLTGRGLGRMLLSLFNSALSKIPYVNKLFTALQQITGTLGEKKGQVFQRAVLVPYPTHDSYSIGFVNGPAGEAVSHPMKGKEVLAIFVPTTPNPTSGFLLYIESSKVKELDVSVETAVKMVMAAGTVTAEGLQRQKALPKSYSRDMVKSGRWVEVMKNFSALYSFPKKDK